MLASVCVIASLVFGSAYVVNDNAKIAKAQKQQDFLAKLDNANHFGHIEGNFGDDWEV